MRPHLATAFGALMLCLAAPALAQLPKGPGGPHPDLDLPYQVIDLALDKRVAGAVVAGQPASFELQVTNVGMATVNTGMGIQVVDTLPAGLGAPVSASGASWSCNPVGTSLICNWFGGPVPPGAAFPPITVSALAAGRDSYQNCARVRVTRGRDIRPANDSDCVNGRIERPQRGRYDVGVRKDGPLSVPVGQTATFTIQVINNGPSPVDGSSGLRVLDSVPVAFTGVTANGTGWTCNLAGSQPTQVTCDYFGGQVGAGQQFPVITITGEVAKASAWLNCAEARFVRDPDSNPRDNSECADGKGTDGGKGYDVGIRKAYGAPTGPGGPVTFTLYPLNNGPSPVSAATGVRVVDNLPANFTLPITGAGTDWTCATTGGPPWTVTCDYAGPPVGPGPLPPIEISAAVGKPGKFNNCAEIRLRKDLDLNPRDNSGCARGDVFNPTGRRPDIEITKTALDEPWSWPSGTGVYQFRINNVGDTPVPAGHVFTLTENLPAGMALVSTPGAWSCSPGVGAMGPVTVVCTYAALADLNPAAFIQFDLTVGFTGKRQPKYENCASVAVSGRDGPWREVAMDNNSDCEPAEVRPPSDGVGFDLGLTGAFAETFEAVNGGQFTFQVSSTPTLANGSALVFNGSVLTPATLSPMLVTTPLWSCAGPWSAFVCTLTVTPPAFSGATIPLRLKTYYSPNSVGQPMTFTGQIQMTGNADPVPSNDSQTTTIVLP